MDIISWLLIFVVICVILYRGIKIHEFRVSLLNEEYEYLFSHIELARNGIFKRFKSLPSYTSMILKIWIPLKHYKVELTEFYRGK